MNQALSERTWFRAALAGCLAALALIFCTSCKTERKLSVPESSPLNRPASANDYVKGLIDAPEMFPRERALLEREQELRINWATKWAMEHNKVKVRAIAPVLQLTGDDTLDRARHLTITLVADDITGTNRFLNEYEVRVGPDPALAVVAPAVTASNLLSVDLMQAQEKIQELALDKTLLSANSAFHLNYLTNFGNQVTNMIAAASNSANQLQTSISNLDLQLGTNAAEKLKLETTLTNGAALAKLSTDTQTLQEGKASLQTLLQDENAQLLKLQSLQREAGTAQAAVEWNSTQLSFWVIESNRLYQASQWQPAHLENSTNTAVTVTVRPISLKQIDHLTVDVIRRKAPDVLKTPLARARTVSAMEGEWRAMRASASQKLSSLTDTLTSLASALNELRKVLNITDSHVNKDSRLALLHYYSGQFPVMIGKMTAYRCGITNAIVNQQLTGIENNSLFTNNSRALTNMMENPEPVLTDIFRLRTQIQTVLARLEDNDFKSEILNSAGSNLVYEIKRKKQDDYAVTLGISQAAVQDLQQLSAALNDIITRVAGAKFKDSQKVVSDNLIQFYDHDLPAAQKSLQQFKQSLNSMKPPESAIELEINSILAAPAFSPTNRLNTWVALTNTSLRAAVLRSVGEVDAQIGKLHDSVSALTNKTYTLAISNALSAMTNLSQALVTLRTNVTSFEQQPPVSIRANYALQTNSPQFFERLGKVQALRDRLKPGTEASKQLDSLLSSMAGTNGAVKLLNTGALDLDVGQLERGCQQASYLARTLGPDDILVPAYSGPRHTVSLELGPQQGGKDHRQPLTLRLDGQILTNIVEDLDALPANERHPPGTKTAAGGGQSTNTIAVLTNGPFRFEVTVEPSSPQTETGNTNWLVVRVNEQPLMMIARNAPNKSMFGQADIQGSPVDGAGGCSPVDETPLTAAAPNIEGMEGRIANGDEAVFRFNVVRGIVTTTAFLVPDDGAKQLFGGHFANQFYVAQVTLCNPNQQPILVYGNTLRLIVRMTAANPTQLGDDGYPTRVDWWATYQPMDYKAVLLMLQRSTARDWRSWLAKGLDLGTKVAGFGTLYTTSLDAAKGIAFFSGTVEPAIKDLLLEDLKKNEDNFQKVGLNEFEEIQPGASLTKYLFLPKGPIFGDYSYDHAGASQMALSAKDADSTFGKKILRPTFIYNIRREEAYVEGKRILSSDPLSSVGTK